MAPRPRVSLLAASPAGEFSSGQYLPAEYQHLADRPRPKQIEFCIKRCTLRWLAAGLAGTLTAAVLIRVALA